MRACVDLDTIDAASAVLDNLEARKLDGLADLVAAVYGITLREMLGTGHNPQAAWPRHHLWAEIRATYRLSYPDMGRIFLRDWTSIRYALKAHAARRPVLWAIALEERGQTIRRAA